MAVFSLKLGQKCIDFNEVLHLLIICHCTTFLYHDKTVFLLITQNSVLEIFSKLVILIPTIMGYTVKAFPFLVYFLTLTASSTTRCIVYTCIQNIIYTMRVQSFNFGHYQLQYSTEEGSRRGSQQSERTACCNHYWARKKVQAQRPPGHDRVPTWEWEITKRKKKLGQISEIS